MPYYCLEQCKPLLIAVNPFKEGKEKYKIPEAVLTTTTELTKYFCFNTYKLFPSNHSWKHYDHTAKEFGQRAYSPGLL